MTRTTPTTAYILIADGTLDQVCETNADARRERKDLQGMGCQVSVIMAPWSKQDKAIEMFEAGETISTINRAIDYIAV